MGDSFDIKYSLLPPDLQMKLWVLALDANTEKVNIAYKRGGFVTSLAYNYQGNAEASLSIRRFSARLGVNPLKENLDLGLVYRGFNFGASASYIQKSGGLTFGYGAELLPFPPELSSVFNSAAGGLQSMAADIRAAPNNPLAWYNLHHNDISTIGSAINTGKQISKQGDSGDRFGVGLRLNYSEQTGLTIYGGVQLKF